MNEFKVGLLALATMMAIAFMSFKITSNQSGFGQYIQYRAVVKDASGIFPKTPIKVAGINAGRISSIELQGNSALISFEVLSQIRVPRNSKLRIKSVGFLGDKYLEIFIGDEKDLLKRNDFIDAEEGAGIENLIKDTQEVLGDVKVVIKSLKDSIAPPGEVPPMKRILSGIAEVVENAKAVTASLKHVIQGNEEKLDNLIANLESASYSIAYQMDNGNSDSAMNELKKTLSTVNKTVQDLQEVVADVKRGKGTVGKLLREDDIADEVKTTLASVKKIVNKVDAIRTELNMFSGVNSKAGGESEVGLKILPSPERFYALGLATSEFGPESERHTITTVNGGTETTEIKKERDKNTYRFNVQVGRKIQDLAIRGGLIESTGGVGLDYSLPSVGTTLSVEAFDYRKDIGANVRVSSEVQVWNVVYGKASLDDSARKERSATVSAGLRFTDEDLKGLLGFFL